METKKTFRLRPTAGLSDAEFRALSYLATAVSAKKETLQIENAIIFAFGNSILDAILRIKVGEITGFINYNKLSYTEYFEEDM